MDHTGYLSISLNINHLFQCISTCSSYSWPSNRMLNVWSEKKREILAYLWNGLKWISKCDNMLHFLNKTTHSYLIFIWILLESGLLLLGWCYQRFDMTWSRSHTAERMYGRIYNREYFGEGGGPRATLRSFFPSRSDWWRKRRRSGCSPCHRRKRGKCVPTAVSWHVVSWVTRSQGITVTSSTEALDTVDLKCKCGQREMKY